MVYLTNKALVLAALLIAPAIAAPVWESRGLEPDVTEKPKPRLPLKKMKVFTPNKPPACPTPPSVTVGTPAPRRRLNEKGIVLLGELRRAKEEDAELKFTQMIAGRPNIAQSYGQTTDKKSKKTGAGDFVSYKMGKPTRTGVKRIYSESDMRRRDVME